MSRATDLKLEANRILKMNKMGSFQKRNYRKNVIENFIDSLSAERNVPASWFDLNKNHILSALMHWRKRKLANDSLKRYIGEVRCFLQMIKHEIIDIDNKSLDIYRSKETTKVEYNDDYLQKISDPIVLLLIQLQTNFGLTLSESFRFTPDLHNRETYIMLSRDMTNNSKDRIINIVTKIQKKTVQLSSSIIEPNKNPITQYGYHALRERYRNEVNKIGLTPSVNYRYVFAKKKLSSGMDSKEKKEVMKTILDEMKISSRTLRNYLNE